MRIAVSEDVVLRQKWMSCRLQGGLLQHAGLECLVTAEVGAAEEEDCVTVFSYADDVLVYIKRWFMCNNVLELRICLRDF